MALWHSHIAAQDSGAAKMLGMAGEDYTQECNWVRQGVLLKTQAFEDSGESWALNSTFKPVHSIDTPTHHHPTTHSSILPSRRNNPFANPPRHHPQT